jgi:GTPase-activating protein SST2
MVSLPLTSHRVRFRQIEHTFTSEEAITNLGSLKFSQSNRMPDPKDPSRIVTTTTTTTFSMAKEMAKSVCQKFLDARFIESADGRMDFNSRSAVWQLTPKGMHILHRFCLRNGIQQDHVRSVLESPRNTMKLVILEREPDTDRLSHDQATVEVIFRRFVGTTANAKADVALSDSDSLNEYSTGLVGVKMADERKIGDRVYRKSFTGKAATDWLMDCCTMVDRRETIEIASLFVEYGLIAAVETYPPQSSRFQASKSQIYYVTERGQRIAGWISSPQGSLNGDTSRSARDGSMRDSNANRMQVIVRDPALRLLFREYLRHTHCEENLSFYIDVSEFLNNYRTAKRANNAPKLEFIRETLAAAYSKPILASPTDRSD